MKYSPYYSRYINERKRKAKAAYITKVMAGVVLALAMSSSSFMLVSADTETLDAALGEEDTAEVKTIGGNSGYNPEDLHLHADDDLEEHSVRVNLENPDENDSPADILNQLYVNYADALNKYNDTLGKYKNGDVNFTGMQKAYIGFINTRDEAQEAYNDAKIYYDSEYAEYVTAMAEYDNEYAKYLMEKSEYDEKIQEYNDVVRANAEAMEQYAKEMEQYAKDMTEYRAALDKWNEFVSNGGNYEEALAQYKLDKAAYDSASDNPVKMPVAPPKNPGNAPKLPEVPEFKTAEYPGDLPKAPTVPKAPMERRRTGVATNKR